MAAMMTERDPGTLPPRKSDEKIAAAVADDPDQAPVRTEAEMDAVRARELERDLHGVLRLRRRLGLGQIAFANRYKVPLGTLRNWEQGRAEPDRSAKVLLAAIAANPEGVAQAAEHAGDPTFLARGLPRQAA
jgi:putative transcriptional regulator